MIGDAGAERYAKTVDPAIKDPATDGLLVILALTGLTDPAAVAEQLTRYAKIPGKPVIASWMGGHDIALGEAILNKAGIPTYAYPDAAARVFQLMWSFSANLKALYETPAAFQSAGPDAAAEAMARAKATESIRSARENGRTLLTEAESKSLLAAYGIPTVATEIAATVDQAVEAAGHIGYPVVLKLLSKTITHKSDVGGVQLDPRDEAAVRPGSSLQNADIFGGPENGTIRSISLDYNVLTRRAHCSSQSKMLRALALDLLRPPPPLPDGSKGGAGSPWRGRHRVDEQREAHRRILTHSLPPLINRMRIQAVLSGSFGWLACQFATRARPAFSLSIRFSGSGELSGLGLA